ncbi:hypothetical protein VHEMI08076 [[Torrubiella] hemipterigena]|uniref:Uncharacterized protein n=1 Tax=[Torrubiella] hemipterigena TaxID=1531966 RepID=A0A0A1TP21_9HYPO|nr:hypothetical protein VHEMI08076 [[Torrubiella] hemipterigena]
MMNETDETPTPNIEEYGVMEYVSIPWHGAHKNGLGYNVALWFIHILARNDNELATYPYQLLVKQGLPKTDCSEEHDAAGSPARQRDMSPCEAQAKRRALCRSLKKVSMTNNMSECKPGTNLTGTSRSSTFKRSAPETGEYEEMEDACSRGQLKRRRI